MAATLLQEGKKILQEQKNAAIKLNESLQRLPNFGAASNSFTKFAGVKTAMSKPSITNCPNTFFIIVHSFNCIFSSLSCFACVQIRHTPVSGGYCGEVPPLPIPNREVKLTCADGTYRIMPKAVPGTEEKLALVSLGDCTPGLAPFLNFK